MGVLTVSEEPTLLSAALGLGLRVAVMEVALGVGSSCCFLAGLTKNESMVRLVDMVDTARGGTPVQAGGRFEKLTAV
jgi:hypothetical protein